MAKIDRHSETAKRGATGRMTATNVSSPSLSFVRLAGLFMPAERRLLALVAGLCIACVLSAAIRAQAVDWPAFFPAFGGSVGLVILGAYVRATRPMPQMALGAIGFGIFMCFTGSVAIFIFTLFPVARPLIDPALIKLDASLGYSWAGAVEDLARFPIFGKLLRYVYLSILPQMVAVIMLLAYLNRAVSLHRFLAVGIICMILTVALWAVFPSIGPGAYATISPEVQAKIGLVLDSAYSEKLRQLAAEGLPLISPAHVTGVIAFPSFHMIMACMVVWFTRATWAFVPAVVVNLLMVPATLTHGGHHLIDLIAGIATFAVCLWATNQLVPLQNASNQAAS